jgi:hypothetical protein
VLEDGSLDLRHQLLVYWLFLLHLFFIQHLQGIEVIQLPASQPRVLQVLRLLRDAYAVLHGLQVLLRVLCIIDAVRAHGQANVLGGIGEELIAILIGIGLRLRLRVLSII